MKKVLHMLLTGGITLCGHVGFSQKVLYEKISNSSKPLSEHLLFQPSSAPKLRKVVSSPTDTLAKLSLNRDALRKIETNTPPTFSFPLYIERRDTTITLDLVLRRIHSDGFKVTDSQNKTVTTDKGLYYNGIIRGDSNSLVSMSIIGNEISGFVSDKHGNLELTKLKNSNDYVCHSLTHAKSFICNTTDESAISISREDISISARSGAVMASACRTIELYFEADHSVYLLNGGSLTATAAYLNRIFSQVATLYENEDIHMVLSQVKIWDTPDPYAWTPNTETFLNIFGLAMGGGFPGDLAHCLTARDIGGGQAYVEGFCIPYSRYKTGVSARMDLNIENVPAYSWNVNVIAHELGHNLGSPHTHSCTWPGGPIDGCVNVEDGDCDRGPIPVNGGTIMSYCHTLWDVGINFANGFGPLPGNLMRNRILLCAPERSDPAPYDLSVSEIYASSAILSWKHEYQSIKITLEYRVAGESAWTSITIYDKSVHLTTLQPNTSYEWRIKTNCSEYVEGPDFITDNTIPPQMDYCEINSSAGCVTIGLDEVVLDGTYLSRSSGCSSSAYTLYDTPVITLVSGSTYSFSAKRLNTSSLNEMGAAIWIDLNRNGVFEDSERLAEIQWGYIGDVGSGTITIPEGSPALMNTRMRIVSNRLYPPVSPCEWLWHGETEDYLINIANPVSEPCPIGYTLAIQNVSNPSGCNSDDGSILFRTNLPDGNHVLNFTKNGQDDVAVVSVTSETFKLEGLSAGSYSAFSISNGDCLAIADATINLTPPAAPVVSISGNTSFCTGTFTTLTASAGDSYLWSTGATTGSIDVNSGGIFTVTVTVNGCSATESVTVTALPCQSTPVAVCTPATVGLTDDCNGYVPIEYVGGNSYDPDGEKVIFDREFFGPLSVGTHTVTLTVKNTSGFSSSCQTTVTIVDNKAPVASAKDIIVYLNNEGRISISADDLNAGSYDGCTGAASVSLSKYDFDCAHVGVNEVTLFVKDGEGNLAEATARVTVIDNTPPQVQTQPLSLALDSYGKAYADVNNAIAGLWDNCGIEWFSLEKTDFNCNDLGTHNVTLWVIDRHGNQSSAQVQVTVYDPIQPQIIVKDATIYLDNSGNAQLSFNDVDNGSWDNCGIHLTLDRETFGCNELGEQTVTIKAFDTSGNNSEKSISVTVKDTLRPTVTARVLTVYLDENGKASVTADMADSGSFDNCSIDSLYIDREAFGCEDLGENTLTLTAVDASGNMASVDFTVIVKDSLAPTVKVKNAVLFLNEAGQATLAVEQVDDGSSDNCGITTRSLQYQTFNCNDVGDHEVLFTATDAGGNSATVPVMITVRDTITPRAIARNAFIDLDVNGKAALTVSEINDGSYDNCNIADISLSQTEFTCSDLGRKMVTLTVMDVNGNSGTERAEVIVNDPLGVCPCSYSVISYGSIFMNKNLINAGGVGVIRDRKKVQLRNTVVDKPGTFVKAPRTNFDWESEASVYMRGKAPEPDRFIRNERKNRNDESVRKTESKTLAGSDYDVIKVRAGATLTLSAAAVYIRSLKIGKNAKVVLDEGVNLYIRGRLSVGRAAMINSDNRKVKIFAGRRVNVGRSAQVNAYLHTEGSLRTRSSSNDPTTLSGFFVAQRIRGGRGTEWEGKGLQCKDNEDIQATIARKKLKAGADDPETVISSQPMQEILLKVWPNPAYNKITISVESYTDGGAVYLLDMQGNSLWKKTFESKTDYHELDIRRFKAGSYILYVKSGEKTQTLRFVKDQ